MLKKIISITAAAFIFTTSLFAEILSSPTYGYSIDLPEEYVLAEKSTDGTSYVFTSKLFSATTVIKIYPSSKYKSSADTLKDTVKKLKAQGETEEVSWRNQKAAVSTYRLTLGGQKLSGYGICAFLSTKKSYIVALCYCPEEDSQNNNSFMVSTLDSLCIDQGSLFEAGLMTQFIYPESSKKVPVNIEIDGVKIYTLMDSVDSEAANYVIEREYDLLLNYQKSSQWKQAWTRYYRMIYRDSFKRLQRASFDIYNELAPVSKDDTDLAQKILTWTQNFEYARAEQKTDSDFTSLPDVLLGKGSDCDSRSMLISVLLRNMNMDSIFFISAEYSHAIAGLVSTHPGHSFIANGKKYLTGETTAKGVTWGMISQTQSDAKKWIPVVYQ